MRWNHTEWERRLDSRDARPAPWVEWVSVGAFLAMVAAVILRWVF